MSNQTLSVPAATVGGNRPRSYTTDLEMVHHNRLIAVLTDSVVLARRSLKKIPRQPDWLMGATIQPIMFLLLFRYIFAGSMQYAMPAGVSAVNYLIAGIIVQGIVFGSINTALGLATDAKEGLMDRFRVLPMTRSSVLLGRILADTILIVIVTTITILAGLAVGFRPNGDVLDWLRAIGLMLLFSFALSWVGAIIGLGLKSIEAVSSIGLIWIFPFTFISSAFAEPSTFPSWMQGFAKNQPFTLVVDSVRGWLTGYPDVGNKGLIAAAWLVGLLAVAVPLAIWTYERRAKS
ncbi:MAG: ABC transporter permease [Thermomicrobiales bacterium]